MAKKAPKKDEQADEAAAELLRMGVGLLACVARDLKDSKDQIQVLDAFGVSSPLIAKALVNGHRNPYQVGHLIPYHPGVSGRFDWFGVAGPEKRRTRMPQERRKRSRTTWRSSGLGVDPGLWCASVMSAVTSLGGRALEHGRCQRRLQGDVELVTQPVGLAADRQHV